MGIKNLILLLTLPYFFHSCGECKPDKFGEVLELVVPLSISPAQDIFSVGDTLTIEANFSKEIEVYNRSSTIRLDSFKFFTLFGISEISGTVENYEVPIDTIVEAGKVGYLPLQGALAYPLEYDEYPEGYHLKFKIVIHSKGVFWLNFSSAEFLYEESNYDHPALYTCDNNRRDKVNVYFKNSNTTLDGYNHIFRTTKVEYLLKLMDFERYSKAGSISIMVQ